MLLELLVLVSTACSIPVSPEPKSLQNVRPDYKVIKYTFTRKNDTDVLDQKVPDLQLFSLDFLCEFCQVAIFRLKERQATEDDFEQKIREECLNSTKDSKNHCDVINRVNLEFLKNDNPKEACQRQGMCNGSGSSRFQDTRPPATLPDQNIKTSHSTDSSKNQVKARLTIHEKSVNASFRVEDLSQYS